MHVLDVNEIFWVTFYTFDRIMELWWKNWPDAYALYTKLVKQSRIQQTNQTKSLNAFLKEWLGRWDDRLKNAKKILKQLWLIDDIDIRDEQWKIRWHYVRVNFLINENKVRNACMTYNLSTNGFDHDVDLPTSGWTDTNALSTKYINAWSTKLKISSSSDSNESSSEVLANSNLLNSNNVLGDNDYTAQFDIFWKTYPHARKWKKQDAKKYFMQQDIKSVMENVKLYKWKIELWIEDAKYVPACERWIRDFVPVNNVVKEQDLYKIVCKHMQMDGKKERYTELKNDFGTEKMDELVRKYNTNNKPTLYFK